MNEVETEISSTMKEKKSLLYTLVENFIENRSEEMSVTSDFSNADLIIMLDDLIEMIKSIIIQQIKQLKGELSNVYSNLQFCIDKTLDSIDQITDRKKEKIANYITKRPILSEDSVYKSLQLVSKEFKGIISNGLFHLEKCLMS